MNKDKSPCKGCQNVWMDKDLCLLIKCEELNEYQQGIKSVDLFIGDIETFRDEVRVRREVRE
jgi:hypothetical protein